VFAQTAKYFLIESLPVLSLGEEAVGKVGCDGPALPVIRFCCFEG
jgi:hypothetical protein